MSVISRHPWIGVSISILIGAARILLSIAVVYAFLATLMTASAQQSISAAIKDVQGEDGKPLTYSQAYLDYKKSQALLKRREEVWKDFLEQQTKADTLHYEDYRLKGMLFVEQKTFVRFRNWLANMNACNLTPPSAQFSSDDETLEEWELVKICAPELDPSDQKAWAAISARQPNFKTAQENWRKIQVETDKATRSVENTKTTLNDLDKEQQKIAPVAEKFGDFDLLGRSWMRANGLLEGFPPATLQILLAFMSGAFGALLIAQILVVYPKSQLGLVKGEGYEARIALGGMVAVCVYIVLGSGAILLGDSSSLEGGANVMTFAGVGVLAGMFSDRVAAWLSQRADFFFDVNGSRAPPGPKDIPKAKVPGKD